MAVDQSPLSRRSVIAAAATGAAAAALGAIAAPMAAHAATGVWIRAAVAATGAVTFYFSKAMPSSGVLAWMAVG
jgi:hypothetical protein